MRLIDADKLKSHYSWWNNEEQRSFDQIVDAQPTAETVVHGEWKRIGGKLSWNRMVDRRILACSRCGNYLSMEGVNAGRGDANYCPNCGAKMDKLEG